MLTKRKYIRQIVARERSARDWEKTKAYREARREHMFLLRCEGLTLRQIADRMGISGQTVNMHLYRTARRLAWAMRRTRYWITGGDDVDRRTQVEADQGPGEAPAQRTEARPG